MKQAYQTIRSQVDKSVLLNPENPKYSLIWLHGLGDTPDGFQYFYTMQQSPLYKGARIKLLHAPIRSVTINGGMKMPSWYDIKALDFKPGKNQEDKYSMKELKESLGILDHHVQLQKQFWQNQKKQENPFSRIFVGGFSQGCATSLLYGLTAKNILAGVLGASGHAFQSFDFVNIQKLPIILFHGTYDPVIPITAAKHSYQNILNKQKVTYKQYKLQHQFSIEQLLQANKWLENNTSHLK